MSKVVMYSPGLWTPGVDPSWHAPTFLGADSGGGDGNSSGNIALGALAEVHVDDLAIAFVAVAGSTNRDLSSIISSSGGGAWTVAGSELYANDDHDSNLIVAYKFINSGDISGGNIIFGSIPSGTGSEGYRRAVALYRGVNTTTPMDVTPTTATGTNASTVNPPSITPVTANTKVVAAGMCAVASNENITATGSLTARITSQFSAGSQWTASVGLGDTDRSAAGAFDPSAWTISATNTSNSWAAVTMALRGQFY